MSQKNKKNVVVPVGASDETRVALRQAFDMIDTDGSGKISAGEIEALLTTKGSNVDGDDVKEIMKKMDNDGADELDFDEFLLVIGDVEGMDVDAILNKFVSHSNGMIGAVLNSGPLYMQMEANMEGKKQSCFFHCRMSLAKILDGPRMNLVILIMVVLDVFCVTIELILAFSKCGFKELKYYDKKGDVTKYPEDAYYGKGCECGEKYSTCTWKLEDTPFICYDKANDHKFDSLDPGAEGEKANKAYKMGIKQFWIYYYTGIVSKSLLGLFAFQVLCLMFCYGLAFWTNKYYLMDLIIVGTALGLELAGLTTGPFLIILVVWRILRVVHGFFLTYESHHHDKSKSVAETAADSSNSERAEARTALLAMSEIFVNRNWVSTANGYQLKKKFENLKNRFEELKTKDKLSLLEQDFFEALTIWQGSVQEVANMSATLNEKWKKEETAHVHNHAHEIANIQKKKTGLNLNDDHH